MATELQVFVLVRVTVNTPLIRASPIQVTHYWNNYLYWCQCECSLTMSNMGKVGHVKKNNGGNGGRSSSSACNFQSCQSHFTFFFYMSVMFVVRVNLCICP